MKNWKSFLNADATAWLLEPSNPHVRYFALKWLQDRPERDAEVAEARRGVAVSASAQKLIARQRPQGYWGSDPRPHHGTRGPLMLFFWLGAPKNKAIEKALAYLVDGCLRPDGEYAVEFKDRLILLPCHGAALLQYMLQYGYVSDARTQKLLDWLVSTQQPDGVWTCPSKSKPFPCMWATADVLRAFRALPRGWTTAPVKTARARAVDLFLRSHLSQYGRGRPDPAWFRFGFPLQWTSDILDVMESIAPFVTPEDQAIAEGLECVLEKQDKEGRWPCEKFPKGGKWFEQYVDIEKQGEPSKWVTLHVYHTLKRLYA